MITWDYPLFFSYENDMTSFKNKGEVILVGISYEKNGPDAKKHHSIPLFFVALSPWIMFDIMKMIE